MPPTHNPFVTLLVILFFAVDIIMTFFPSRFLFHLFFLHIPLSLSPFLNKLCYCKCYQWARRRWKKGGMMREGRWWWWEVKKGIRSEEVLVRGESRNKVWKGFTRKPIHGFIWNDDSNDDDADDNDEDDTQWRGERNDLGRIEKEGKERKQKVKRKFVDWNGDNEKWGKRCVWASESICRITWNKWLNTLMIRRWWWVVFSHFRFRKEGSKCIKTMLPVQKRGQFDSVMGRRKSIKIFERWTGN